MIFHSFIQNIIFSATTFDCRARAAPILTINKFKVNTKTNIKQINFSLNLISTIVVVNNILFLWKISFLFLFKSFVMYILVYVIRNNNIVVQLYTFFFSLFNRFVFSILCFTWWNFISRRDDIWYWAWSNTLQIRLP